VLLLGGSKSLDYLKAPLGELQAVLPHATRVELAGVGHVVSSDGERPDLVAAEIKKFLGA
jgi:hypothetical protein